MNINTSNYQKIQTFTHYNSTPRHHKEVSFKGNYFNTLSHAIRGNEQKIADFKSNVSALFGISGKDLEKYTQVVKKDKIELLYKLAEKFNLESYKNHNFERKKTQEIAFEIYRNVKKPQPVHSKLVRDTNYTFAQIKQFVETTNKEPQKLELADKLLSTYPTQLSKSTLSYETMDKFLSSKYAQKINRNYNDYKPFIELNEENPNIVEQLEQEINNGYSKTAYQKRLKISETLKEEGILNNLSIKELERNYQEERINLLHNMQQAYSGDKIQNSNRFNEILLNIYNSTNQSNNKARNAVISYIQTRIEINKKFEKAPLETVERIFNKIDDDKQAQIFIEKTIDINELESISQLDEILQKANLEKLNKRPDIVSYGLSRKMNISKLSHQDFKDIDAQIKKIRYENKKYQESIYYHPNPIVMELHRMKIKVANYIERAMKNFNKQ